MLALLVLPKTISNPFENYHYFRFTNTIYQTCGPILEGVNLGDIAPASDSACRCATVAAIIAATAAIARCVHRVESDTDMPTCIRCR